MLNVHFNRFFVVCLENYFVFYSKYLNFFLFEIRTFIGGFDKIWKRSKFVKFSCSYFRQGQKAIESLTKHRERWWVQKFLGRGESLVDRPKSIYWGTWLKLIRAPLKFIIISNQIKLIGKIKKLDEWVEIELICKFNVLSYHKKYLFKCRIESNYY